MNYSQPDFYHFSEDSTKLADYVFQYVIKKEITNLRCADVCAGCGVVGLEFALRINESRQDIKQIDFYELQDSFVPHLKENLSMLKTLNCKIYTKSFKDITEKYDLILSNPPYFIRGTGKVSTNKNKDCCRFFKKGEEQEFMSLFKRCLTPQGVGIFLSREDWIDREIFEIVEQTKLAGATLFVIRYLHSKRD